MSPNLTSKLKKWKMTSNTIPSLTNKRVIINEGYGDLTEIVEKPLRLPCKWIRPLNDMYVACWNKEKVRQIIEDDVGILRIGDREYCRGVVDDMPDCWDGLETRCIEQCKHYIKGTSKFNTLKGFCTKQCKNFELFKREVKYERTKMIDFEPKQVIKIEHKKYQRIREISI